LGEADRVARGDDDVGVVEEPVDCCVGAKLRDSSFTNKGNAMWLLLSTVAADHAGLELVRSTAPGEHKVVVSFVPFDALSGADFAGISAIAPDDSVLVARAVHGGGWDEIVVETDGGASFALPAGTHVSGFVPTALANTLGIAGAEPVPATTAPPSTTATP
jgi:hypothetical protein